MFFVEVGIEPASRATVLDVCGWRVHRRGFLRSQSWSVVPRVSVVVLFVGCFVRAMISPGPFFFAGFFGLAPFFRDFVGFE